MTLSGNVPYDLLFGKTDPGSGGAQPGKGYPNGRPKKPDSTPAFFFSGFFGIPKMSEKTPGSGAELQVFDSVICHFQPSLTSVISFIFFHIEFDTTLYGYVFRACFSLYEPDSSGIHRPRNCTRTGHPCFNLHMTIVEAPSSSLMIS